MDGWLIWLAAGLMVVVLLSTAASFSLRLPSRARLVEKMELQGRADELARLLTKRGSLVLATAVLRAGSLLGFVLVVLEALHRGTGELSLGTYVSTFALSLVCVLVFGVGIPSAWARYAGESLLIASLPVLHIVGFALYPLVAPLLGLDWLVRRLAGAEEQNGNSEANKMGQEILTVVSEGEARGAVDEEEKEMIESIIELRDAQVDQIMTPRTGIDAAPTNITFAALRELILEKGHSRIPVYEDTVDNIIGIVYAKDLLHVADADAFDVTNHLRTAIYIPESKKLRDLLHEFQEGKGHMAIVLDEYGGTAGLATIEDILEELVGEITDEYEDQEPEPVRRLDESTVEVDARMRIDDLNDELNLDIPESEDYETIGGFVFSSLGRIPAAGDVCEHDAVKIQVTDVGPRTINRVQMHIRRNRGMG